MSMSWITLLTFVSITLLVLSLGSLVYDGFFRYRLAVRGRLKGLSDAGDADSSVMLFKDMKRMQQDAASGHRWRERLRQLIEQAGMQCSLTSLAACCAAAGVLASLTVSLVSWWLIPVAALLGALLPIGLLQARRRARTQTLCRQLPDVFQMISRAVRAGQTVPAALKIVAEDFQPPVSEEFALCYQQQDLGVSRESALRQLAVRTGVMELQIFVVALLVQSRSGGDLVELLEGLSAMIRKRLKLKERVKALTGEGRMQALVLLVLPILAMVGIVLLSPDYAAALFARPWLLAATLAAQLAGAFWIWRIVNIEY